MALTNAEKQAKYRERHLENGTKTRGHFILEATTKAKLLRLAHHRNCSVTALIDDLAARAERRATSQMPPVGPSSIRKLMLASPSPYRSLDRAAKRAWRA